MARIRSIKPEFTQSESLGRVSRDARLLFILLWTHADDAGRFRANPRLLACELFPYDDDALSELRGWLEELEREGCVQLYRVGGDSYGCIPKWKEHQKIDHPSPSRLPPPPEGPREPSPKPREPLASPRETLGLDRKGKEGSGEEKKPLSAAPTAVGPVAAATEATAPPPPLALVPVAPPAEKPSDAAAEVFWHWRAVMGKDGRTAFDAKRRRAVKARLADGYTVDQLKRAVDGCAKTPHNMGQNDRGERYDDLELICRDAAHVDRFIANAQSPPTPRSSRGAASEAEKDWSNYDPAVAEPF